MQTEHAAAAGFDFVLTNADELIGEIGKRLQQRALFFIDGSFKNGGDLLVALTPALTGRVRHLQKDGNMRFFKNW